MTGRRDGSVAAKLTDASTDRLTDAPDSVRELLLGHRHELVVCLEVREKRDLARESLSEVSGGVSGERPDDFTKVDLYVLR